MDSTDQKFKYRTLDHNHRPPEHGTAASPEIGTFIGIQKY